MNPLANNKFMCNREQEANRRAPQREFGTGRTTRRPASHKPNSNLVRGAENVFDVLWRHPRAQPLASHHGARRKGRGAVVYPRGHRLHAVHVLATPPVAVARGRPPPATAWPRVLRGGWGQTPRVFPSPLRLSSRERRELLARAPSWARRSTALKGEAHISGTRCATPGLLGPEIP